MGLINQQQHPFDPGQLKHLPERFPIEPASTFNMFANSWHCRSKKTNKQQLQRKSPQWIGLWENLQETIDFPIKNRAFPIKFSPGQSH